jgi:hypothetical protein
MATAIEERKPAERRLMMEGIGMVLVLLLALAAFDDITTDNDTDFAVEYAALAGCGLWLLAASVRLLRRGHQILGGVSLAALAGALWGHRGIGPGMTPEPWPEYLVMVGAFVWFGALTLLLFVLQGRAISESSAPTSGPGKR